MTDVEDSAYRQRCEQILDLAKERDKYLDEWLRWVVAIAVGCLSILIPLSKADPMSPWAMFLFRSTCVFMGVGIVALSIRIYAFYLSKKSIIEGLVDSMKTLDRKPVMDNVPEWMKRSEIVGYVSLIVGICCLILFACVR